MIHPIPPGTRDVLPEEMRELRHLENAILDVFDERGYGLVSTPTIEYEEVLARGSSQVAAAAYKLFDPDGAVLSVRTDMTVPIARLVASRYDDAEQPLRLCYSAAAMRMIRPQRGQQREFTQIGVELLGAPAPEGTAEVVDVLVAALDAAGLRRARIGLGDADLFRSLLDDVQVGGEARDRVLSRLVMHDFVGLEREVAALDIGDAECEALTRLPRLRGGAELLDQARATGVPAVDRALERLKTTLEALDRRGVSDRIIIDLGLLRDLGYYSGAILEVYDPAIGHVLGGGGRYDELLGRFGHPMPAAGFALQLDRLHVAAVEEERLRTAGEHAS
ncbi:MAG: ATP phosphoribosyltransferase regulatory subunit [Solirubrobacterales bacterium]